MFEGLHCEDPDVSITYSQPCSIRFNRLLWFESSVPVICRKLGGSDAQDGTPSLKGFAAQLGTQKSA